MANNFAKLFHSYKTFHMHSFDFYMLLFFFAVKKNLWIRELGWHMGAIPHY